MKRMLFLLMVMLSSSAMAQKPTLKEVRLLYQEAESRKEAAENLLERLASVEEENPVLMAYKAGGTMLMAKHVFFPFKKLSYFNEGKKILQQAIDAAPENIEIRFLRFTLQSETPGFLGYKDDMERDKRFLLQQLPNIEDADLLGLMLPFLKKSDYLTEEEKQELRIK